MSLVHINFENIFLNGNTDVNIILPEDFYKKNVKYKILWLLYRTFGDYTDWIGKSNIELYAGGYEKFLGSYEDIRGLMQKNKDKLPPMYFACGKNDFLYEGYCEFKNG